MTHQTPIAAHLETLTRSLRQRARRAHERQDGARALSLAIWAERAQELHAYVTRDIEHNEPEL